VGRIEPGRPGRRARRAAAHRPPVSPVAAGSRPQGNEPVEAPVTGCCGGDGRLVADVARRVVEDRFRLNVSGLGLRGAALLAAANPAIPAICPAGPFSSGRCSASTR
jgi:hypothetical protein